MKNIILKSLEFKNFKGIKDLKIDFSHRTDIAGDNATGKTTVFDGFTWLLFGKDSSDRADFGIKTYTDDGDTLHGVDHSVKGVLEVDGQEITLERIYSEKWTKQRGRSEAEFTGHTTDYLINSVPVKKSDYDSRIAGIIHESHFKLLTNPHYFNEILDKRERREIILNLEQFDNQAVLDSMNPEPKELKEKMDDYTIDEIKAMTKASMKRLNDEIKDLPVRIDELTGQIKEYDFKALELEKKDLQAEYNLLSGQMEDVQQIIQAANAKAKSLATKKNQLDELERQVERQYRKAQDEADQDRLVAEETEKSRQRAIQDTEGMIESLKTTIHELEQRKDKYRHEWVEIQKREAPEKDSCRSCGQPLPEDQYQETIKRFNRNKSDDIENVEARGQLIKLDIDEKKERLNDHIAKLKELLTATVEIPEKINLDKPELPIEWHQLKAEIEADERAMLEETELPNQSEMTAKRDEISGQISILDEQLGQKKRNAEIKDRINDLKQSERDLAKSYEQEEKLMKQAENFIRAKVEMISSKVNSHFENVEFKLFDVQINGGITETCEAKVNGVPYSDVNNAGKINAGLDVINTLSNVYQSTAPIFVDNAESVNQLTHTDSQLIRLIVSNDKGLTVN